MYIYISNTEYYITFIVWKIHYQYLVLYTKYAAYTKQKLQ